MRAPRLHQPSAHLTAMAVGATLITAFAAASPSLRGSFVGGNTTAKPAAVVQQDANTAAGAVTPVDDGTYTTVVQPPDTVITNGPGQMATIVFNNPSSNDAIGSPLAGDGIPVTALEAYQHAADSANATHPSCHIPWPLLAGIGRVESDHGRYGGAVLRNDGTSTRPIIGIPLNGNGTEVVSDTDNGAIDGDPVFDRAVGPMQFIPSTWAIYGTDGNQDGLIDPFNIFDAAAAAANYLCTAGGDLSTTAGQTRAVLSYNHSTDYLNEVLALEHTYASGDPALIIPDPPAVVPPVPTDGPGGQPPLPPVNPGPPLAGGTPGTPSPGHSGSSGGPKPHPSSSKPAGGGTGTRPAPSGSSSGSGAPTTSTSAPPSSDPPSSTTSPPSPSDTGEPSTSTSTTTDPATSSCPPDPSDSSSTGTDTGSQTDEPVMTPDSATDANTLAAIDTMTAGRVVSASDLTTDSSTSTATDSPTCG